MQRQLGLKKYEPIRAIVHKLRKALDNESARHTLGWIVVMNKGYFMDEFTQVEQSKGKRGRGASGRRNVAEMAESTPF